MNDSSAEFDPDDAPAVLTRDVFATSTSRVPLLTTDHQGLDVLSPDECRELLRHEQVGRIGFNQRGQTVILPVNYAFVAGSILFRTTVGSKLDIAQIGAPASFEIDDFDVKARTGWSVLVKGHAAEVTDEWLKEISRDHGLGCDVRLPHCSRTVEEGAVKVCCDKPLATLRSTELVRRDD